MTIVTSRVGKVLIGAATLLSAFCAGSPPALSCPRPSRSPPPRPRAGTAVVIPLPAIPWPFPTTQAGTLPPLPFPFPAPTPAPAPTATSDGWPDAWARFEDETLILTNARRAQGAVCGDRAFPPAPPLAMVPSLRAAAREHSTDMGQRNYFAHASLDGRSPADRVHAAGWPTSFVGENIFGGPPAAAEVVDGWMKSPGHCENIMNAQYRWIGVGYADVPGSSYQHYWTQDFGGP